MGTFQLKNFDVTKTVTQIWNLSDLSLNLWVTARFNSQSEHIKQSSLSSACWFCISGSLNFLQLGLSKMMKWVLTHTHHPSMQPSTITRLLARGCWPTFTCGLMSELMICKHRIRGRWTHTTPNVLTWDQSQTPFAWLHITSMENLTISTIKFYNKTKKSNQNHKTLPLVCVIDTGADKQDKNTCTINHKLTSFLVHGSTWWKLTI